MADATTDSSVVKTPLQYLDKAMSSLRDLGLVKEGAPEAAPITGLLEKISDLDPDKIAVITRTLGQMSAFNEIVREQISEMSIGQRYEEITKQFNSIRDDAKGLVDQIEDGKITTFERLTNMWMKFTRGDIADRFDKIKKTYLDVTTDAQDQIRRERLDGAAGPLDAVAGLEALVDDLQVAIRRQRRLEHGLPHRVAERRLVVGQQDQRGDAADRRGDARTLQRLLVLLAGLAGVDARIDDAGREVEAAAIDRFDAVGCARGLALTQYSTS